MCKYFEKGKQVGSEDPKVKYLFIYTDNTATVGWDDSTGVNREVTNSNNKAMDGYRETPGGTLYRGVRNWSANKGKNNGNDGVVVSANDSNDAYSGYSSSGKCSAYMVQRAFGSSNFFWLSPDSSDSMYKKTISNEYADMSDKNGTHTIYFNVPLSEKDLNMDMNFTCVYGENGSDKPSFSFNMNTFEPTDLQLDDEYVDSKDKPFDGIYYNSSMFSTVFLQELEKGKCPQTILGCQYSINKGDANGRGERTSSVYQLEITGDISSSVNENFCIDKESSDQKIIDATCIGDDDNCSAKAVCKVTSEIYAEMEKYLGEYGKKTPNSSEARDLLNQYNRAKDRYNTICVSILKYRNFTAGTCTDECVRIGENIAELETKYHLRNPYGEEKCNIGEQVVAMVYNVLKWAKYIAPILVIILTILDFIKALAAQSDDDMKKAQGKFIKRLIVAALLFLLPLIINFALKTFGFYSSSCDITDLF